MDYERDRLSDALVAVIRDLLIEGHRVVVPGLGTFSVRHVPSKVAPGDDGPDVMLPPRDVVDFEQWSGGT